ncbi:hypothetical protein PIB30_080229 [Stylosanthes scabra]|uniref:Uncharacterized protein n=1 Tax=Stylosanthes scabra TaxID=79078 RepID=A0ABU6UQ91_9FABA|nr:hypothetical protein [Stylosanthes scabra]
MMSLSPTSDDFSTTAASYKDEEEEDEASITTAIAATAADAVIGTVATPNDAIAAGGRIDTESADVPPIKTTGTASKTCQRKLKTTEDRSLTLPTCLTTKPLPTKVPRRSCRSPLPETAATVMTMRTIKIPVADTSICLIMLLQLY